MSAIGAIYACHQHVILESDLLQLNQAMHHHGQNGSGIWFDHQCGLTQQHTKLTVESLHETMPYYDALHQITVVTHCRLFNHKELRDQLVTSNNHAGEAELIIRAYLKWGISFVRYLIGEFSLILWGNPPEK